MIAPGSNRVVLVDVDGTVALMRKGEEGRRGPFEWSRVGEDDPNAPIVELVEVFRSAGFGIVFLSGRDAVCRNETTDWLMKHEVALSDDLLYMRPNGDYRPDNEIKLEIYRREIEPRFEVAYVLDDRDKVVTMWRSLGLTVLQVAPGDF